MTASTRNAREEKTLAEIGRLSHAGLDGLQLLRRLTTVLKPVIPFDSWCAATTDPVSNLIGGAAAGREPGVAGGDPYFASYFDRVYFEHDLNDTLSMLREGRVVSSLSERTDGDHTRSARYRLHLQPRHLGPEVYSTFVDRGLWGELHLTREEGSPDFSAREIAFLKRVIPPASSALKAAALRARATLVTEQPASQAPAVLILDDKGRVVSSTPNVEALLTELGDLDPLWRLGRNLPTAILVVLGALERSIAPHSDRDRRTPRLRVRGRSGRWLTLDASLTEPVVDRPRERVVVVGAAQPEDVTRLNVTAYELSPREEAVVRQVVRGLSTKQIAEELFIAEHTVQRHLSNIFEKVGVRSRRDLVKRLFVEQILPALN